MAKLKKEMPPAPAVAHVVSGNGPGMKVYIRGNPATKGEDAPEGLPASAAVATQGRARTSRGSTSPTPSPSKDNPLTARVIVNRVWAWHFGRGLVNTPSNFGALGDRPSHPELLDWLAVNFVKNGWSLKWLHRQIMLSARLPAGQQAGRRRTTRSTPRTCTCGAATAGGWTSKRGATRCWRSAATSTRRRGGPTFDLRDANAKRRTVYAKVSRHELDGLLRLFDFPDANVTADKRTVTTVPQQQLFALNSEFMAIAGEGVRGARREARHDRRGARHGRVPPRVRPRPEHARAATWRERFLQAAAEARRQADRAGSSTPRCCSPATS